MVVTPALRCLALTTHTCTGAVEQMERAQKSGQNVESSSVKICTNIFLFSHSSPWEDFLIFLPSIQMKEDPVITVSIHLSHSKSF